MVWDPFRRKRLVDIQTPHQGNIFSVKFIPRSNNRQVLSGAADGKIFMFDVHKDNPTFSCCCHSKRIKRLAVAPDNPNLFWSSAEDGLVLYVLNSKKLFCIMTNFNSF